MLCQQGRWPNKRLSNPDGPRVGWGCRGYLRSSKEWINSFGGGKWLDFFFLIFFPRLAGQRHVVSSSASRWTRMPRGRRTREKLALIPAACCTRIKCSDRLRAEKQARNHEPTRAGTQNSRLLRNERKCCFSSICFAF